MSLVRVRVDDQEFTTGADLAASQKWEVLDEPTHLDDGQLRPVTRLNGRPSKPRTSVAEAAAKKNADQPSANTKED